MNLNTTVSTEPLKAGPELYLGFFLSVTDVFATALSIWNPPLPTRSNGFVFESTVVMV